MKNFYFLAMICLSFVAFVGCSKKEDNKQETKKLLLGTWKLIEVEGSPVDFCFGRGTITFTESELTFIDFTKWIGASPGCEPSPIFYVDYKIKGNVIVFARSFEKFGFQEISAHFKVDGDKLFVGSLAPGLTERTYKRIK